METINREFVSCVSPTAGRNGAGYLPCQGLYHTPKGERPFRVTVDTLMTGPTEAINIHNAGAQKQILDALGMGALAELKK